MYLSKHLRFDKLSVLIHLLLELPSSIMTHQTKGSGTFTYPTRVVAYLANLGLTGIFQHSMGYPNALWWFFVGWCLIYPHLFWIVYTQAQNKGLVERSALSIDIFMVGIACSILHYSYLPSIIIFITISTTILMIGGVNLLMWGFVWVVLGGLIGGLATGFAWVGEADRLLQLSSSVYLLLYSYFFGYMNHQGVIEVKRNRAKIREAHQQLAKQTILIQEQAEHLRDKNDEIGAQSEELQQTNEELLVMLDMLHKQKEELDFKNNALTESITYASRIQVATLPSENTLHRILGPHYFIFFRPRDIVSGDFYYCVLKDEHIVLAAVDCTGHGVPGAFMSLIGNDLLNDIILNRGVLQPAQILEQLHEGVQRVLQQKETNNYEGMEIALVVIPPDKRHIHFAGAKRPLVFCKSGELQQLKGSSTPIGGAQYFGRTAFEQHTLPVNSDTWIYLFSDGYQDQFGGKNNKKLGSAQLRQLFLQIHQFQARTQAEKLQTYLTQWTNASSENQVDDILVIGLKVA
jgi:serine phosphatase RsbU (regulator of sigma subunit)